MELPLWWWAGLVLAIIIETPLLIVVGKHYQFNVILWAIGVIVLLIALNLWMISLPAILLVFLFAFGEEVMKAQKL